MTEYRVKKIKLDSNDSNNNYKAYWDKVNKAPIKYCKGIKELRNYCGGTLHRISNLGVGKVAYSCYVGDYEYYAEKC